MGAIDKINRPTLQITLRKTNSKINKTIDKRCLDPMDNVDIEIKKLKGFLGIQ